MASIDDRQQPVVQTTAGKVAPQPRHQRLRLLVWQMTLESIFA